MQNQIIFCAGPKRLLRYFFFPPFLGSGLLFSGSYQDKPLQVIVKSDYFGSTVLGKRKSIHSFSVNLGRCYGKDQWVPMPCSKNTEVGGKVCI